MAQTMPNITIAFSTAAAAAVTRSDKGTVALLVRGTGQTEGVYELNSAAMAETKLSKLAAGTLAYVKRAFTGYVNPPKKVICIVQGASGTAADGLETAGKYRWDYLAAYPDVTSEEAQTIAGWVKTQRTSYHRIYKAVLPDMAADSEAVVNFTTKGIKTADSATYAKEGGAYGAGEWCSRMAGLIAGTPMRISATYAALPEVTAVEELTAQEQDTAVGKGQLILVHDGAKCKTGRAVTSLVTTTKDKGAVFQKIKLVETADMIGSDIRTTIEDSYIGKYANTYANKQLLISAISGYLAGLARDSLIQEGYTVGIDVEAQRIYLESQGVDVSAMSEEEIRKADTGSQVFLAIAVKLADAIEDVAIQVAL